MRPDTIVIEPIGRSRQREVLVATEDYIVRAEELFARTFERVPILFDLWGRAAGQYRVRGRERHIRYNPYIFAKYFADGLSITVPHEVAHFIVERVYGLRNTRPHGDEWQALMHAFGAEPSRTFAYNLDGIPMRTHKRHPYRCGCRVHELTTRRHNRLCRGESHYRCRQCGQPLVMVRQ